MGRLVTLLVVLAVVAGAAVHATEDAMAAETAQRMTEQQGAESVAKHSQDAQAAEMMAEEERNESQLRKSAEEGQGNDLGESGEVSDQDPAAPWVEDEKQRRKAVETRKEEAKIEAVMNEVEHPEKAASPQRAQKLAAQPQHELPRSDSGDDHPDLGESDDVAVHAAVHNDANALTDRAQTQTSVENIKVEKVKAMHRAKAIADKVRKLVKNQKKLENVAGKKVAGSVLGEAEDAKVRADALSRKDTLLAHKLEDQQAQSTMEHLINTERTRQAKMFEEESSKTHDMLASVRSKLKAEQDKMTGYVKTETMAAVKQVEGTLSQTKLANKIEDVVKKKLSARLQQLQKTAEKTVSGVEQEVTALKSRVRRLRRQQTSMRIAEAQRAQEAHRDLGESASVGSNAMELQMERMRMEQNMMRQQMMMQQQMQPQMMQPAVNSPEHEEFLMMKKQMSAMRQQNQLLSKLLQKQQTTRLHKLTKSEHSQYTHSGLAKYFQNKHLNAAQLKKDVLAEQARLKEATAAEDNLEATSLLQLSEGAKDPETATALPLFNQRAEQARVESEDLIRRAEADALAMEAHRADGE